MKRPLLEQRSPVGISYALLVLTIFFFVMPSAFRAARLSLGNKENNVKDWLPSDFPETAELEWFGDHFAGESFVLATWPGCTADDQRLDLFRRKLIHESDTYDPTADFTPDLAEQLARAKEVGRELQLLTSNEQFNNWGGLQEKWLAAATGAWYYITPDGRLYRWEEAINGPASGIRSIRRRIGTHELKGQLVTAFGEPSTPEQANPFYNDPSLLCAPLFHSVQTGASIVDELAQEGGALWPVDLTEEDRRGEVARRLAIDRLTGTLFAPAMTSDFAWNPESFREALPPPRRSEVPEDFDEKVTETLQIIADEDFDGSVEAIHFADTPTRTAIWYRVFDATGVQPPPRLTCLLVTLTDMGKENLGHVIGRGVMGGPQGRLLQLAAECGLEPAPAPSMAPPPFNTVHVAGASGRPPLRLGGPPVDNFAIDEEGTITLVRLVGYSIVIGIILSYLCFGSLKITTMVFIVGGSAAMLSLSFVWWTGGKVDAILMSMPSLVYVLGISGAIHVINYYRDEVRAGGKSGAPGRALRHALLPCSLASVTTAIGLASLSTSNLAPISNFGMFSAIGVIATLAILFSYLPAALQTFAPNFSEPESDRQDHPPGETWLSEMWASVGRWITANHAAVTAVCLFALFASAVGLAKIQTSVQLLKLFDQDSRIIRDYAWLEENFGKLVPMELIVRIPEQSQSEQLDELSSESGDPVAVATSLSMLERVEAVSRIEKVVRRTLGENGLGVVGQSMSADTFLPPSPAPRNGYWPTRTLFNRELLDGRDELLQSDYLRVEKSGPRAGSELWRISLRVGALSDVDYGQFISTLRTAVEPALRAYDTRDELMRRLAIDDSGNPAAVSVKDQIIVVGSGRPPTLDEIDIMQETPASDDSSILRSAAVDPADRINQREIYLATLGELLSGEAIKTPAWVDPEVNDKWKSHIGNVEAVIWLGGGGLSETDFAGAKRFIDARAIFETSVEPKLIGDRIPDVDGSGAIQVVYTGVVPVVYKAQRTLLSSLVRSIGMAFVMIALVMIVLLNPGRFPVSWLAMGNLGNGLAAGAVSMIPNVFPVLLIFGLMGHGGVLVDIGTMMTASVAMGVAVDDTIHFLSWFRTYLDKGMDRTSAVIETYRRVGPAMTQTTIVGGLGLFVFALSTFTPTQRFGTLMLVLLSAALVGDLILLPALLAGPAGRWFKPRTGERPTDPDPDVLAKHAIDLASPDETSKDAGFGEKGELRVHFPKQRTDKPHRAGRD